jgi:hypothetical protein
MDKKYNKKFSKKLIILIIILFLILLFSVIFSLLSIGNSNILTGVSIGGIDVSGLSKEDATSKISDIIEQKVNNKISILVSDDTQTDIDFSSLDIEYDISPSINEAFNLGRFGNIFENNFTILNLLLNKKNIDLQINIDDDKLNTLLSNLSSDLPNKLVQNSYYIEDSNLILVSGSAGFAIDTDSFKSQLSNVLNNLSTTNNYIEIETKYVEPDKFDVNSIYDEIYKEPQDAYYTENPLKIYSEVIGISFDKDYANELLQTEQSEYIIPLEITTPSVTTNDLDIDIFQDLLASFTTKYDVSNTDRSTNLELAASKINGIILSPGEEFSYNTTVGARTIAAGYKEAKIYSNGEVVDGIGGGICQISSTLYNVAVFANLNITERHNHQFITSYVPAGRDATVAYGSKDLKFVNNRSYPIKIEMKINNGIVSCSFYGIKEDPDYKIDFDI